MRTGLERLIEDVKKDCQEGCFNMNGCDHEFSKILPETDPKMKNLGITKKCVKVSKCTHKYCDKLFMVTVNDGKNIYMIEKRSKNE